MHALMYEFEEEEKKKLINVEKFSKEEAIEIALVF